MNNLCICASENAQMHTKSGVDPGSSLGCASKDAQMHKCTLIDFDGTPSEGNNNSTPLQTPCGRPYFVGVGAILFLVCNLEYKVDIQGRKRLYPDISVGIFIHKNRGDIPQKRKPCTSTIFLRTIALPLESHGSLLDPY